MPVSMGFHSHYRPPLSMRAMREGQLVTYEHFSGAKQAATLVRIHDDRGGKPFYTVSVDGVERQTVLDRLSVEPPAQRHRRHSMPPRLGGPPPEYEDASLNRSTPAARPLWWSGDMGPLDGDE